MKGGMMDGKAAWLAVRNQVFNRGPVYCVSLIDRFNEANTVEASESLLNNMDVWEKCFCRNLMVASLWMMAFEIDQIVKGNMEP